MAVQFLTRFLAQAAKQETAQGVVSDENMITDEVPMAIDYDRARNIHTIKGARAALPALMEGLQPRNLLDVGCGAGVWMRVALDLGIVEVWGIDGVALPPEQFHMPKDHIVLLNDEGGMPRTYSGPPARIQGNQSKSD